VYEALLEAYDRGGPPFERCLTRLGYARSLLARDRLEEAGAVNAVTRQVAERHGMRIVLADARRLEVELADRGARVAAGQTMGCTSLCTKLAVARADSPRAETGYHGPIRP
jgi:hypothetical protein